MTYTIHASPPSFQAFRVLRRGQVVWEGPAKDLRRFKDSVNEVGEGNDCGVLLEGFDGERANGGDGS